MVGIEDYKKRLDDNTNEVYDNLKNQEYTTLLKKEVALENSKANAVKYTNNMINAAGFGGTGYGSSLGAGVYNTYLNKAQEADSQYNENLHNIEEKRRAELINNEDIARNRFLQDEERDNQIFANVLTDMQLDGMIQEDLDNYMVSQGYGTMENGKFVFGDKPEGMSDLNWNSLQTRYGLRTREIADEGGDYESVRDKNWLSAHNVTSQTGYSSYQEMVNDDLRTENADYGISDVKGEATALFEDYNTGRQNGDCVRLEHWGGGSTNGIYLVYYNGKWYPTTKATYDNATNSAFFKKSKFKEGKGTFRKK